MARTYSFNQKILAGFAAVVALAVLVGVVAVYALRSVVASKDHVITINSLNVADAARLDGATDRQVAAFRGFLLSGQTNLLDEADAAQRDVDTTLQQLQARVDNDQARQMIGGIAVAEAAYAAAQQQVVRARQSSVTVQQATALFESQAVPKRTALGGLVSAFSAHEQQLMQSETAASNQEASTAVTEVAVLALFAVALALLLALLLARALTRQVGEAVQHVQSSSSELQAAANQQASGAKESATAMNEIATTISELLATSRQIADSAQQVTRIAQQTAGAARSGDQTVERTREAIGGIRQQVDQIVAHMLDLGRKSQQIGGVLDIINELAEQTNILSINATIEAAGAGESGKRFAVVGEEIRKLAERVTGSTKEVRGLIEEIRAAVNTTVMATEGGSKAVDAGMRQFAEVTAALEQITGLVGTTTDAAREIELSTKQQATAVEQVNAAITGAAQATRETEASATQTLQTATQLAGLSRELTRIVQSEAAAPAA